METAVRIRLLLFHLPSVDRTSDFSIASQVDISSFDTGKLGEIITKLSGLSEIPDVSTSVNRFVNSMARLANSGEYIANVSAELPGLGRNLKSIVESFTSVGDISEPVNRLVQSIAQLASSGNKIGQTSSQLGTLAKEGFWHNTESAYDQQGGYLI